MPMSNVQCPSTTPVPLWLHCDLKDMAYLYTHLLFDKLVVEGDLR